MLRQGLRNLCSGESRSVDVVMRMVKCSYLLFRSNASVISVGTKRMPGSAFVGADQ